MRKVVFMMLFSYCLVNEIAAQENIKILTFQDAVKIALQNSVILNQQKNNLELSQMQKLQSIAAIGPTISATGTASQFNGNSFNNQTGQVVNGVRDNLSGSVNANINLFSGFSRLNSIRQYTSQLDAQNYLVNRTAQDVINSVSTQYLQVMLDVELLKIAKENFDALGKQLLQVKEQVNLGARSPVDEYNQDALTKAAQLRFIQAEINLNNDKAILTQTLLIDPFEEFEVEKPNWDVNALNLEDESTIQELADRAKQYRGDYLRALKQEAAYKYSTAASRGFSMPSLYAFGNYGSAYNFQHNVPDSVSTTITNPIIVSDASTPTGYGIAYSATTTREANPYIARPFAEQFRQNNVYKQYGLQLTIPLFSGLQNRTSTKQQKVLYENAQLNRKNVEYQIKNDVIRAVRNYKGAKQAYTISLDQVKAAEIAFQLEKERYDLGVTNFVDFTNANRALVQAQTDKAQAEYRLVFQRILYDYALGTLKLEDLEASRN